MSFSQFLLVLRARRKLALSLFFGTIVLVMGISFLLPKKYTAVSNVVVEASPDAVTGMLLSNLMSASLMATQVDIINSDRVARKVIRNLHLDQDPGVRQQWKDDTGGEGTVEDWLGSVFQRHLDVKPSRDSNVIQISYTAPDPKFAAGITNAFVQAYLETTVELRVDPARQYSGFFDARIKQARDTLASAQAKLSDLQQQTGITVTDERLDVETARLNELSTQLVTLQALAADSGNRERQVSGGNADRMNETLQNPVISSLKVDISRAEAQLKELDSRLGANNPQVIQTKAHIDELRSRLEAESSRVASGVGVSARIDAGRVAAVKADLDAQRAKVLRMRESRDKVSVLQRDVENAQRNYDVIVARASQTSLESQTQQSNVHALSEAQPPFQPSSPKLVLNAVLSIFLGGLLAIFGAVFAEARNRRIRSTVDIVDFVGLPVLGVLPAPAKRRSARTSLMAQRVISGRLAAPKQN